MEFLTWFAEHWILGWLLILLATGAVVRIVAVIMAGLSRIVASAVTRE